MAFPNSWPPGCPPADGVPANGIVFRLTGSNPPLAEHFRTFAEMGKQLRRLPDCPCMPYGLSVFRDRDDAEHMYRLFPLLGRFIASGTLAAEHGVTKLTPGQRPTHTTWWPAEGLTREALFGDVEEII